MMTEDGMEKGMADAADQRGAPAYTAEDLERVVRRAAELQSLSGGGEAPVFSEEDVVRIAADVGVSAEHVREAMTELRARDLLRDEQEEHPLVRWLFGSAVASASRRLSGPREAVQSRIESALESDQGMQPMRRAPGLSVWEPSGDLLNMVQRLTDFSGRRYRLAEAETITLNLAGWDRDHTLVNLQADLGKQRNERLTGWGVGLGIGLFMAWGLISEADSVLWWLLLPLGAATGMAAAIADVRHNLRRQRGKFRLVLEGLLDGFGR